MVLREVRHRFFSPSLAGISGSLGALVGVARFHGESAIPSSSHNGLVVGLRRLSKRVAERLAPLSADISVLVLKQPVSLHFTSIRASSAVEIVVEQPLNPSVDVTR
jgi:hypothetical protein